MNSQNPAVTVAINYHNIPFGREFASYIWGAVRLFDMETGQLEGSTLDARLRGIIVKGVRSKDLDYRMGVYVFLQYVGNRLITEGTEQDAQQTTQAGNYLLTAAEYFRTQFLQGIPVQEKTPNVPLTLTRIPGGLIANPPYEKRRILLDNPRRKNIRSIRKH